MRVRELIRQSASSREILWLGALPRRLLHDVLLSHTVTTAALDAGEKCRPWPFRRTSSLQECGLPSCPGHRCSLCQGQSKCCRARWVTGLSGLRSRLEARPLWGSHLCVGDRAGKAVVNMLGDLEQPTSQIWDRNVGLSLLSPELLW